MNPADLPTASHGIERPCPRCDAEPGAYCTAPDGKRRDTTHRERKPKGDDE